MLKWFHAERGRERMDVMPYDNENVFAKILRGELPCHKEYENDTALAFYDLHPKAKIHILVIPKGPYEDFYTFHAQASSLEIEGFYQAVLHVLETVKSSGYKLVTRSGIDGGQEVPHFHLHVLGGQKLD